VAISSPIEYEGNIFYSDDELRGIKIPTLLLNSEDDDGAEDNRRMLEMFTGSKDLHLYSGDAHGTELFKNERESIVTIINSFVKHALEN